jgi:hypothetical protein
VETGDLDVAASSAKPKNAHGRHTDTISDFISEIMSTISQNFASPEGEGFPPSPKETLKNGRGDIGF